MKKKEESSKKDNSMFLIIVFVVIIVLVMLLPKIHSYIESLTLPKVEKSEDVENKEEKIIDDELLSSLHYPIMRNSIYSSETYYSLNKFKVNNMSNKDILYDAFLDIYEGNIVTSNVYGECVSEPKEFSSEYLELRIKNILSKNINYTFESFYVPVDSSSPYKGRWDYDSVNKRFIYNAYCSSNTISVRYYDLEQYIKSEFKKDDLIVYKYVGFAKVEGNNYIIYSDAKMTNQIHSGTFTTVDDLNNAFNNLNNNVKKIYKYTFKDTLCSYNEYCLYEGEWVNGI